jgi:hypothetical protein
MDKQFEEKYIDKELNEIGKRIKKQINIYLIGGASMSFRNLKESTKDIDIVFANKEDCDIFRDALFGAQYYEPITIKSEYKELEAIKIYENKDGFTLDLFIKHVLRKLEITNSMIKRSELHKIYGNLSVYLLSKEDIFLFKGLASENRHRDLDDMRVLYPNLKWDAIVQELESQKRSEFLREWFVRRLEKFIETYGLDVPILNKLKKKE